MSNQQQVWPLQRDCVKFYGDPRGKNGAASPKWEADNLVLVKCPWVLRFEGKPVQGIRVHKKCAESLARVLNRIWERLGKSQEEIDRIGMSVFGGSYVFRNKRGAKSLSMHAFGAAVDFDPERNALGNKKPAMDRRVIEEFEREGWEWGGHWKRPDGMHFQAARTKAKPDRLPLRQIPEQGKITIVNAGSKPESLPPSSSPPPIPPQQPVQLPPTANYPGAVYRSEIERLQSALKHLGYHEVGLIDGKWGPKTASALLAFKLDNGLPLTPVVDDLTWMTLARAAPRKVSQAREEATEPPSVAAKAAKGGKVAGGIIGGAGLLDLLLSPFGGIAGVTDFLIGVRDTVGAVQDAASPIRDLGGALASNWQLLTLLAGVALFIVGKYVFDDELQSFKRGEWS